MKKELLAGIIAAATALSVMGCADDTGLDSTASAASSIEYDTETKKSDAASDASIEQSTSVSVPEASGASASGASATTASADASNAVSTEASTTDSKVTADDPAYKLGRLTENTYTNEFLNLKLNIPEHLWNADEEYLAKYNNIPTAEGSYTEAKGYEIMESGEALIAAYSSIDMDSFEVVIIKDESGAPADFELKGMYESEAINAPQELKEQGYENATTEMRKITFLGEETDVLTVTCPMGNEKYTANYLYYMKNGYMYCFELSGFSDFISYFENATSLK